MLLLCSGVWARVSERTDAPIDVGGKSASSAAYECVASGDDVAAERPRVLFARLGSELSGPKGAHGNERRCIVELTGFHCFRESEGKRCICLEGPLGQSETAACTTEECFHEDILHRLSFQKCLSTPSINGPSVKFNWRACPLSLAT